MTALTPEEAGEVVESLGLRSSNSRGVALRLLLPEGIGSWEIPHASAITLIRRKLRAAGYTLRSVTEYSPEQKARLAEKLPAGRIGTRWFAEQGKAAKREKREKREKVEEGGQLALATGTEVVAPKPKRPRGPQLPPLPEFLGDLKVTGQVLTDSGAVEIHLRNGEGTYIAELVGYRRMTVPA